ncbi:MAG: hypothetical protein HY646_18805 [Acidobacteria bacterium]|nr:hypothetical protein [Acidobacteriota bacterium]
MNESVHEIWKAYLSSAGKTRFEPPPPSWHFCDNPEDADACAALVLSGRKTATSPSKWYFEWRGLGLPAVGDQDIVTDWQGVAQCIIRTPFQRPHRIAPCRRRHDLLNRLHQTRFLLRFRLPSPLLAVAAVLAPRPLCHAP